MAGTGYVKSAYENVVGHEFNTPTLSTKILYAPFLTFESALNPEHLERDDEARGVDEPIMVLPERYAPTWGTEVRAYPDSVGFRLKQILGAPVSTTGNGVITDPDSVAIPTGAFRHVWTAPFGPSGDAPLTTDEVIAYKDQSVFFRLKGAATESLSIESPETGGVRINPAGMACYMARISDPGLTPTYETLATRPFMLPDLTIVTWLTGSATSTEFSITISNSLEELRDLGVPTLFRPSIAKGDLPVILTGSIAKRAIDPEDWDALLAATGFGTKSRWTSRTMITGSYPYKLYVESDNSQYMGGGADPLASRRRHGATFDWKNTSDGAGASTTITLINNVTNYN